MRPPLLLRWPHGLDGGVGHVVHTCCGAQPFGSQPGDRVPHSPGQATLAVLCGSCGRGWAADPSACSPCPRHTWVPVVWGQGSEPNKCRSCGCGPGSGTPPGPAATSHPNNLKRATTSHSRLSDLLEGGTPASHRGSFVRNTRGASGCGSVVTNPTSIHGTRLPSPASQRVGDPALPGAVV